jgi:hypothetical protein
MPTKGRGKAGTAFLEAVKDYYTLPPTRQDGEKSSLIFKSLRLRVSAMKMAVPKALWTAVAAATALLPLPLAHWPYESRAESGSCCYRSPKRFAHFHSQWRAAGSWESAVRMKGYFTASLLLRPYRRNATLRFAL